MRRRIDIAEVESATKIRAKYLRALENEDWDLLPGPTYVKTFLRSYAEYLELDARRLVDEYKRRYEHPRGGEATPFGGLAPGGGRPRRQRRRSAPGFLGPVLAVGGIAIVLLAGLFALGKLWPSDSGSAGESAATPTATPAPAGGTKKKHKKRHRAAAVPKKVKLRLVASGPVYVCLVDRTGKPLIDGQTLSAGQRSAMYTGKRFRVNFGTSAVRMLVNGKSYAVAPSANPVGYEIRPGHKPSRLPDAQRPACA
jgi:cytoskeleton protein RodZ